MNPSDPTLLTVTHLLNSLLMVAFPIGLGIYLTRRFKLGWSLWGIGAGTFILSQIGHIPFNAALTLLFERGFLPAPPKEWALVVNVTILGLSAGLWEELSRYATYRWWAKDARSWRKGILLGAGHGGIEAVILGGLVLFTFFSMINLRGTDLSPLVKPEELQLAQAQVNHYWNSPWYDTLLGALERLFTLPVHIGLSVLVLQVFVRRQKRWLWLAIGWHALMDAAAVYTQARAGVYPAEGVVALSSLLSLAIIFALRLPEPQTLNEPEGRPVAPLNPRAVIQPVQETAENLEQTRYH